MDRKARVTVLVSGGGTNLQAIIDAQNNGIISSGEVTLVISDKAGAYALERAKNAGIRSLVLSKADFRDKTDFEARLIEEIDANGTDLIVLAGFLTILSESFVKHYPEKIINVHPSLIPSFCGVGMYGLKVHEAALAKGVKVTGATVHFVNEIPDGGRIIMQRAVHVYDGDTPEKLQKRVMKLAEHIILPKSVEKLCKEIIVNK